MRPRVGATFILHGSRLPVASGAKRQRFAVE
jgi:hypothetical protein